MKHPKDWKDGECPECGKPTKKINDNWAKCYNPQCMLGAVNCKNMPDNFEWDDEVDYESEKFGKQLRKPENTK